MSVDIIVACTVSGYAFLSQKNFRFEQSFPASTCCFHLVKTTDGANAKKIANKEHKESLKSLKLSTDTESPQQCQHSKPHLYTHWITQQLARKTPIRKTSLKPRIYIANPPQIKIDDLCTYSINGDQYGYKVTNVSPNGKEITLLSYTSELLPSSNQLLPNFSQQSINIRWSTIGKWVDMGETPKTMYGCYVFGKADNYIDPHY